MLHPYSKNVHYIEVRNKPRDIKVVGILLRELQKARESKNQKRVAEIKAVIKKMGLEKKEASAAWSSFTPRKSWTDPFEYQAVKKAINKFASGKILDVGAGSSDYFITAGKKMPDVTAIDIAHSSLIHSPYQKRIVANFNEVSAKNRLPFKSNTFQTVNLAYLLNYIKNPEVFLNEVSRITKKGGRIIITGNPTYFVPNQLTHIHDILRYKSHLKKLGFKVHILTPQKHNPRTKMLIATKS